MPALDQLEPQRICLIKPSALGDVVQTLPVLAALRERWPTAHIAWVVNQSLVDILSDHPQLDEIIPFDRSAMRGWRGIVAARKLWNRLRAAEFDLAIDMQGLLRSGLMAQATGAKYKVGFANAREKATWFYTHRVDVPTLDIPALQRYWHVVTALGGQPEIPSAPLGLLESHRAWALEKLSALPRPLLAIHPGAQWQTKRWPPENFAKLARRAQQEFTAGVVLVGGPGEGKLCREIETSVPNALNLAEQTSLRELAAILESADVLLSGDTGPMHLAAAVGTQTVSIFTCTSPTRAGPHGKGHRIVQTEVPCAASYLKKCSSMICLPDLAPARVWPALAHVLAERTQPKTMSA